jgi:hypothetical protein
MPTCPICNKEMKYINNSHLKSHGLTPTQFKELYPEVDAIPQEIREANKRNSKVAVKNSIKVRLKQLEERIVKYNKSPKKCKCCNCAIDYDRRDNNFCSRNCSTSFNNKNREYKYSENGIKSLRDVGFKNKSNLYKRRIAEKFLNICLICNKEFETISKSKNNKTCSVVCRGKRRSLLNKKMITKTFGKCGYHKGVYCASSWELAFLVYNLDLEKEIKRCELTFKYEIEGEEHLYFPDFIMDGIIYEVKGRELEDVKFKTKAVIEAGYKIELIRRKEINPIIKSIKEKYRVKDITQLYDKKI